jgi:hypothetical protein
MPGWCWPLHLQQRYTSQLMLIAAVCQSPLCLAEWLSSKFPCGVGQGVLHSSLCHPTLHDQMCGLLTACGVHLGECTQARMVS